MNLITTTHRVVAVTAHTRRIPDKPRSTDWLHVMLRMETELEAALERGVKGGE